MEFSQQDNNQNSVISFENNTIQLSHQQLKIPCFISKNFATEIEFSHITDINKQSLFPLISHDEIDLLIIGTGQSPKFLTGQQQVVIQQMSIGSESMNSDSACRSFNLLLSDARNAGLLLL